MSRLSCFFAITLVGCVLSASPFSHAQTAYDSVDPFIGTAGDGNTFPGATLPFGMIQWSPDTGREGWYLYNPTRFKASASPISAARDARSMATSRCFPSRAI